MNLPYTLQNRPTGSTDPKYKADANEVMANLEYIMNAIAYCRLEVDVSLTSENRNCDIQTLEYGASTTSQCNLTHILGESYGGMFLGKLSGGVAAGDKVGIMDSTGRIWVAILSSDDQISFGEGSGGTAGKCTWERIDGGSAYANYNDTTWMNTLTIWHIGRMTALSNIFNKVIKSQIVFSASLNNGVDAADIPLIDSGAYFTTDNVEAALAEFGVHKGDSTDPHSSVLTQTNLTVSGTSSLATVGISGNLTINTNKFTVNATTGNTLIGGTLTVSGASTFNNNVVISGTYTLTVGGAVTISGDLTASIQVITPKIYRAGNLTLEAYSASAQTHIYLKNSDGTYDAVVHVDKYLYFDRVGSFFSALQMYPYVNSMRMNLQSTDYDTFLYIYNGDPNHKASVLSESGYQWLGTNNASFLRTSEGVLELNLPYATGDGILYFKNSQSGYDLNVDIDGDLAVHGLMTGNVDEVVNARGAYSNLNGRLNAILEQSGANFKNCVTVAKSGGQFSTIQAAINSITDAGVNNQYVVLIYPGIYLENLTLKSYVHLVGIKTDACQIGSMSSTDVLTSTGGTHFAANLSLLAALEDYNSVSLTGAGTIILQNCKTDGRVKVNHASGNIYMKYCDYDIWGGLVVVNGNIYSLYSTHTWALTSPGGVINAYASKFTGTNMDSPANSCIYLNSLGISIFEACHIETIGANTHGINLAANGQKFINCIIRATGSGNSFYAGAAQTVIASGCTVNADKNANVTVTPGTVWQTTNTLNAAI